MISYKKELSYACVWLTLQICIFVSLKNLQIFKKNLAMLPHINLTVDNCFLFCFCFILAVQCDRSAKKYFQKARIVLQDKRISHISLYKLLFHSFFLQHILKFLGKPDFLESVGYMINGRNYSASVLQNSSLIQLQRTLFHYSVLSQFILNC